MDGCEGNGGGKCGKNVVWEQTKVLQLRIDRRRGGVGASNTLCCSHYNRIRDDKALFQNAIKSS